MSFPACLGQPGTGNLEKNAAARVDADAQHVARGRQHPQLMDQRHAAITLMRVGPVRRAAMTRPSSGRWRSRSRAAAGSGDIRCRRACRTRAPSHAGDRPGTPPGHQAALPLLAGLPAGPVLRKARSGVCRGGSSCLSNAANPNECKTDCWPLVGRGRGISRSEGAPNQSPSLEGTRNEQKTDHLDRAFRLAGGAGSAGSGTGCRAWPAPQATAEAPAQTVTLPQILKDAGLTDVTSDQMRRGGTRIRGTLPDGAKIGAMLAEDGTLRGLRAQDELTALPSALVDQLVPQAVRDNAVYGQIDKLGAVFTGERGVMLAGKDAQGNDLRAAFAQDGTLIRFGRGDDMHFGKGGDKDHDGKRGHHGRRGGHDDDHGWRGKHDGDRDGPLGPASGRHAAAARA